jgi:hypothetical protein
MGILALFVSFLGLRLYGFILGDPTQSIADTSYDLLAANAVFLFPRLFAALGPLHTICRADIRSHQIFFTDDYFI